MRDRSQVLKGGPDGIGPSKIDTQSYGFRTSEGLD